MVKKIEGDVFAEDDVEIEDQDIEIQIDDSEEGETETAAEDTTEETEEETAEETEEETTEETEETAAGEEDTDEDGELAEFPKKFRSRLEREINLRKRVEQASIQAVEAARLREQEAKQLRTELFRLRKGYASALETGLNDRITLKTAALRRARDEANEDEEAKLQADLDELRYNLQKVKDTVATMGDEPPEDEMPAAAPTAPAPNPAAERWVAKNRSWLGNEKFMRQTRAARLIDVELDQEGLDKNSDEYFAELDRRLNEQFPGFRGGKKTQQKTDGTTKKTRQPVAPVASAGAARPSKNVVKLTKADLADMASWGLDPSNKEHLREYARQKRSAA